MSSAGRREEAAARRLDSEARLAAQTEFRRPLVVEAGAGTGKTAALVARVIAWALGPGWERAAAQTEAAGEEPERTAARVLRRIVAITFTEAAAAEMDERVSEALGEIEAGGLPIGVVAEAIDCPHAERSARAAALRSVLDQMRVHTIHAFCRRLLAEAPLEAGVHPRFEVDADESRQKAIVREVLEEALPRLFASDAMLRLAGDGIQAAQLEEALLLLLRAGAPPDALAGDPLTEERVAALLDDLRAPLGRFVVLEAGRLAGLSRAPKAAEMASRLAALRDHLDARVGAGVGAGLDAEGFAALLEQLAQAGPDVDTVRKWARSDFGKSGAKALGDDVPALAALAGELWPLLRHLEKLDPERLVAAREILTPLHRRVLERLRATGVATFPSLLRDARALLAGQRGVRARVRGQIDQLLVDEFQDTDPVQCDVVRRLALEGPEEQRPGLFLVGDPKQSIYGWRSADLAAYDGFRDEVVAQGGRVLSLVVNHRSAPAILAEVSQVIAPVMEEAHGLQPAFQELFASEALAGDPGFAEQGCAPVEHWISCAWDAEAVRPQETSAGGANRLEARAVADEIARLHAGGVAWRDFGLLFRAGTDLETYLDELRRAGVPFAVEGDRSYFERREIIEAGALVRCVLDPNDQLALLTLLRSSVVGVPDAALIPLWAHQLPDRMAALHGADADRGELRQAVEAAAALVPGDVPGIERIAGWSQNLLLAARSLGLLRESFEEDAADVFVEKLRSLFFFEVTEASRYLGAYRVANLDRFFRDLLGALEAGEGDPQAILRGLREDVAERREYEEGRPKEALADAVQVSTIHKAKGLAFEHVYLLQLHKGWNRREDAHVEATPDGWEYDLLGARTLGYHRVLARRGRVEDCERVRTLYVAATRARRRLVFAALPPALVRRSRSGESHAALLERREAGRPDPERLMPELAAAGESAADRLGARWVYPALREPTSPPGAARSRARLDVAEVRAASEALAARRRTAQAQREWPLAQAISARAHEVELERLREETEGDESTEGIPIVAVPAGPRVAAAVGTAVHRLLERVDLAGDLAAQLERGREALEDELVRELPADERAQALDHAEEVIARFRRGPLFRRWCGLASHFVAREFDVLLPGDPELPGSHLVGVVDLLYRDPETGELVVADYKTDRLAPGEDPAAHASRYGGQGASYARAVQEAFALERRPRFELWFLSSGDVFTPA